MFVCFVLNYSNISELYIVFHTNFSLANNIDAMYITVCCVGLLLNISMELEADFMCWRNWFAYIITSVKVYYLNWVYMYNSLTLSYRYPYCYLWCCCCYSFFDYHFLYRESFDLVRWCGCVCLLLVWNLHYNTRMSCLVFFPFFSDTFVCTRPYFRRLLFIREKE